jgi:hypothetical protein
MSGGGRALRSGSMSHRFDADDAGPHTVCGDYALAVFMFTTNSTGRSFTWRSGASHRRTPWWRWRSCSAQYASYMPMAYLRSGSPPTMTPDGGVCHQPPGAPVRDDMDLSAATIMVVLTLIRRREPHRDTHRQLALCFRYAGLLASLLLSFAIEPQGVLGRGLGLSVAFGFLVLLPVYFAGARLLRAPLRGPRWPAWRSAPTCWVPPSAVGPSTRAWPSAFALSRCLRLPSTSARSSASCGQAEGRRRSGTSGSHA